MRRLHILRRLNVLLLTSVLFGLLGFIIYGVVMEWRTRDQSDDSRRSLRADKPEMTGDVIEGMNQRFASFYREDYADPEAWTAMKIVAMRSGATIDVSRDPNQRIYGFEILALEGGEQGDRHAIGYIALLRNGGTDRKPVFDVVYGDLGTIRQTTILRNVRYLDSPTALDGDHVSMIVQQADGASEFRIYQPSSAAFSTVHPLSFLPGPTTRQSRSAPVNRFQ